MIRQLFEAGENIGLKFVKNVDAFSIMIVERFIFYKIFKLIKREVINGNHYYKVKYHGQNMEILIHRVHGIMMKKEDTPATQTSYVSFNGDLITVKILQAFLVEIDKVRYRK